MSVARQADISASKTGPDHNMLGATQQIATRHWLYELGWRRFFDNESLGLTHAGLIQCVGSKHPRLVAGEVVIERCSRTLPIPQTWNVAVTRHWSPVFMVCWQHADQLQDFTAMYDRLSAEA